MFAPAPFAPCRLPELPLARRGVLTAAEAMARALGVKPRALSSQVQRLAHVGMVAAVRRGSEVHCRIADPCLPIPLDEAVRPVEQRGAGRS